MLIEIREIMFLIKQIKIFLIIFGINKKLDTFIYNYFLDILKNF